jgi:hypothetical protein
MFSIGFQYSCTLLPLAFPVAAIGLEQLGRSRIVASYALDPARLRRAALAFAIVASALVSWKLGAVDPGHAFEAGYVPVRRAIDDAGRRRLAWVRSAVAGIPPDASVAASHSLGPFVSSRREAYELLPADVPQYVLVDQAEVDVGAPPEVERPSERLHDWLASGRLVLVDRFDSLALYRRSP